jgi:hypothetical protein
MVTDKMKMKMVVLYAKLFDPLQVLLSYTEA